MERPPEELTDGVIAAIVGEVEPGAELVAAGPLAGGLSSWMTLLDLVRPDGTEHRLVIRRGRKPDAERFTLPFAAEFTLLRALHHHGIPVATPRVFDDSHRLLPQAYVVLDHVPGSTRFVVDDPVPIARRMAEVLAEIHRLPADEAVFSHLPEHADRMTQWILRDLERRPLDESLRESLVRPHLEAHWPPTSAERCVVHADYFPGNIIWDGDDIAAVIDWESAGLGDPMADVATTRLDLWWIHGKAACDAFTETYLANTGRSTELLPVWELIASLRPAGAMSLWASDMDALGRPDITAQSMRAVQHDFVDAALGRLSPGWRRTP